MLAEKSTKWHKVADVVIIGYGGAGAVAAITAHDMGAEVLILEKQLSDKHFTNTGLSGAIFVSPTEPDAAVRYMQQLCAVNGDLAWTDSDIIKVWAKYMSQNKAWVEKTLDKSVIPSGNAAWATFPGYESFMTYHYRGWGWGFMNALIDQVKARNIEVMHGTTAQKLLVNLRGEVIGVKVLRSRGDGVNELNIKASKAVIMSCGGFEYNDMLKLQYLRVYPFYSHGTPANTGDGIKMAIEIGADLWHMCYCSGRLMAKFPDFPIAFSMEFGGRGWAAREGKLASYMKGRALPCGFIMVDRYGRRYMSERTQPHYQAYEVALFDSHRLEYPRMPSYWIFDQRRIEDGPLPIMFAGACGPYKLYEWSSDNSKEIEKGWIIRGDTVAELAKKIKMQPEILIETVKNYNKYCEHGEDPDYGRTPEDLIPLVDPPYYAVQLWPGGPATHGGPRRNRKAQILNTDGEPITGLYGAGELGSVYGMLDASSGSLVGECIAFGRIAGEHAAAEKPRTF